MNVISKVLESVIENGTRIFKLLKYGDADTVNSYRVSDFGADSMAPAEYKALYLKTSNSEEPVCVGFINNLVIDELKYGEKQVFSTNEKGDSLSSYIRLNNDGTMHVNGDADNLVGFAKNKEGFDEGIVDINDTRAELNKITQALTAWVPAPMDGGAALKALFSANPSSVLTPSTTNIDDSKKDNLKCE